MKNVPLGQDPRYNVGDNWANRQPLHYEQCIEVIIRHHPLKARFPWKQGIGKCPFCGCHVEVLRHKTRPEYSVMECSEEMMHDRLGVIKTVYKGMKKLKAFCFWGVKL